MNTTIAALATPPGEGGIGIIRLSGSKAPQIASRILKLHTASTAELAESRRFYYGWVVDCQSGEYIDEVLAVRMKAPTTYTGEEVVEIHGHGGMVSLRRILALCLREGAVPAKPGEFTERAFLSGRLDLTQAEAVMDLIRATGDAAGRQAALQLGGALGKNLRNLSDDILQLLASLEAWIDFGDDVDEPDRVAFATRLQELISAHDQLLASANTGMILSQGLPTAIIGLPNVGKSSLLNALLGEERAIVSEYPGTTRDVLSEQINIAGVTLRLSDTAGLRHSDDPVERMGVALSEKTMDAAELILLVLDSSRPLDEREHELFVSLAGRPLVVVLNKSDLANTQSTTPSLGTPVIPTILKQGETPVGLGALRKAIEEMVSNLTPHKEAALLTRERHVQAVKNSGLHLMAAADALNAGEAYDCVSIDLRSAWTLLAELTGEAPANHIAEAIFAQFCVGK